MLSELHGKGGTLCLQARDGQIHCPLIVRPTSEDVITGQIVQAFRTLNPRWWLPDLLNAALKARRFRRQVYRRLRVEPWVNMPPYPRELLPWAEGSTQVDVCLTFENPPTTVFVEAKYGSGVSSTTANGGGPHGYPTDQVIRNVRVGLHQCGWFDGPGSLFAMPPRDFVFVLLAPRAGHPLVERYRDRAELLGAIPHNDRLVDLPKPPFIGQLGYADIGQALRKNRSFLTHAERLVADSLIEYLDFKSAHVPSRSLSPPQPILIAAHPSQGDEGFSVVSDCP